MPSKIIPVTDARTLIPPAGPADAGGLPVDTLDRPLRDLRISVTDRCNFRCVYCMPREVFDQNYRFLPQQDLLSFDEIARTAHVFTHLGVEKIRLTGGEPLLRKHLENLVAQLAGLKTSEGRELDLTLTTNGSLLEKKAQALKDAGLKRLTVSLDALDEAIFKRMNDADFPVGDVLRGLDAALRAGLGPIKINMVVKRGVNDGQILPMARHFRHSPFILRFIEYMDVGATNGWRMDEVVPSSDVIRQIGQYFPLEPVERTSAGETAARWRYRDGGGEIGVISSVTGAFCRDCNRARLSTEGKLYTCLFAGQGYDLRALLRSGREDDDIAAAIAGIWRARTDRYSELRSSAAAPQETRRVEMSYIGG
jgi:cyclic pyranopterin phosphate synthase